MSLGVVSLWPALAQASEVFPGALQEAADMICVPDCVLCHGVSPGTATTWPNKALGRAMSAVAQPGDADSLKRAFAAYKLLPANAANVAAIVAGKDPETGADICTPYYGCGATIAHKPAKAASDPAAVVAGALTLLAGLLVMRRRRR